MHIRTISIIGGSGGMGKFFKIRLNKLGLKIYILDNPLTKKAMNKYLPYSDLVLLTIPIHSFEQVVRILPDFVPSTTILVDICSVKIKPLQIMLRYHSGPVVGSHPLFGPNPEQKDYLNIAMSSGREEQTFWSVFTLMENIGLTPFKVTAEEHDRALAYIQGLNFVTTASYLATMSHDSSIEKFLTPSFKRRLDAARKMVTQDANLFQDLFEENPYSHEAVRQFRSFLNLAAAGELDILQDKANWWWRHNTRGGT